MSPGQPRLRWPRLKYMRRSPMVIMAIAAVVLAACGSPSSSSAHVASSSAAATGKGAPPGEACSVGRTAGPGSPVPAPAVGTAAFAGRGQLAFVSSGRVYVLDGSAAGRSARLHAVAAPGGATAPAWSPDGRWLAFLVVPPSPFPNLSYPRGTLWLAGADGSAARPVLANAGPFSWSPVTDVLAATVTNPANGRSWLCELRPGTPPHLVPGVTGRAVWSPDGRQLAFTVILSNTQRGFYGSMLETVPASGGTPVVRRSSSQAALLVAGWWPDGQGLMAWADYQGSASLAADGQPLLSYPLNGGRPVTLGFTLLFPPFLATSPAQRVVAVDNGGDRVLWDNKTILLCAPTGGCTGLPGGMPRATNLDPALDPAGQALMFVHADASLSRAQLFNQASIAAWYKTRSLWVYVPGGQAHAIQAAGTAVADPTWSADGRLLLYVRDDGLWLISPFAGQAVRATNIVSRLFAGAWPNYYAYINWRAQFAWRS
jgi:Tol biopolymer transport system component